jgi:hypothetical protein
MTEKVKNSDLAFEEAFPVDAPLELWRLSSVGNWGDRTIRHINWFATEVAALQHKTWIEGGRGSVVSLTKYRLVEVKE